MERIENILVFDDQNQFGAQRNQSSASNSNRIKMGEVYKIQNEQYSLICVHCSTEFQYFSEFTLHVEEHLRKLAADYPQTLLENCKVVEIKEEPSDDVDTASTAIMSEPQSYSKDNKSVNNITITSNTSNKVESCSEDDFPAFDNFVDYSDDEKVEIEPAKVKEENIVEKTNNKKEEPKKVAKKVLAKRPIKKQPKTKTKRKAKATTRTRNKPKKTDEFMCRFLAEERLKGNEDINNDIFNTYKSELGATLFPVDIKSTEESRLLARFAVRSHRFEKCDGMAMCPLCKAMYKDVTTLRRHIYSHTFEKNFVCSLCQKSFRMVRHLQIHLRDRHKNDSRCYECFICHKEFMFHKAIRQHIDSHLVENLDCAICNQHFAEYEWYKNHMNTMHPHGIKNKVPIKNEIVKYTPVKPVITSFECYLCKKIFRERRQLRNHFRLHSQRPKLCLTCGRQFSSSSSLYRHTKLHEVGDTKPHKCTLCNKAFRIRTYLLLHNRKEHNLYVDNTPPVCKICGESFGNKRELHIHMRQHPFQETRDFICSICNHAAKNAYYLRRHMLTHSTDRSFECEICHKTYAPHYARQHMLEHSQAKKHKCKICDSKFKRPYQLKLHMFTHNSEPELKCENCQKFFSRPDTLARHRRQFCSS